MTEPSEIDERTVRVARKGGTAPRVFRAVGGTALGLIVIAGVGLVILATSLLHLPKIGEPIAAQKVSPVATDRVRVCPGPVIRLGDSSGAEATNPVTVGSPTILKASTLGESVLQPLKPAGDPSNVPPQLIRLSPTEDGELGLIAGSQTQSLNESDLVGFVAANCTKQDSDFWLVAGSSGIGRTSLILLSNPSSVDSQVKFEIFSENGPVDLAGADGITVPAGSQYVISLAGLASGLISPVVHIESEGGRITAQLQESIVRTLTPGGTEIIGPDAKPSANLTIPGVVITDQGGVGTLASLPGYEDISGILRVLVPTQSVSKADATGDGSANITVTAIPEDSSADSTSASFSIDVGKVTDLPLADFAPGDYTFLITSDLPAVAAVRTATAEVASSAESSDPNSIPSVSAIDFAWFNAADPLTEPTLVSVAPGPSPKLHLANTSSESAVVTVTPNSGADNTVTIPANSVVAVPVTDGLTYEVAGYTKLNISVSYQGLGALGSFTIQPQLRQSKSIDVYLG
ncbi:MAG: hypothetical protein IT191_04965 [Microbacteriaceae bacterium]|nr:hypothetical protein [Microbacteriaceae bacterium]